MEAPLPEIIKDDYIRDETYRRYHSKYEPFNHVGSCYYCGLEDEVDDHVPPLAQLHRLRGFHNGLQLLLVRSCTSCNSSLGDMPLMTPEDRKSYIRSEYLPRRIDYLRAEIEVTEKRVVTLRDQLAYLEKYEHNRNSQEATQKFRDIPLGTTFVRSNDERPHIKVSDYSFKVNESRHSADLGEWVTVVS